MEILRPKGEGWTFGKAWIHADGSASSFHVPPKPEPGTICPTCGEKTPNEHALEMRRWRAKQKNA